MGDDAKILGIYDPHVCYDAEDFPYQWPQRKMRPPSRAPPIGSVMRNHGHLFYRSVCSAILLRRPRQNASDPFGFVRRSSHDDNTR
jgi:hypothetical protein